MVTHAYKGLGTGDIEVEIRIDSQSIALSLFDEGRGFQFETVPDPALEELPEGGMGIYIMKNFMDCVEYKRVENRNMLYLEKQLTKKREK